jgi:uncharacterized membrane protein SirB2
MTATGTSVRKVLAVVLIVVAVLLALPGAALLAAGNVDRGDNASQWWLASMLVAVLLALSSMRGRSTARSRILLCLGAVVLVVGGFAVFAYEARWL